jgi:cytochrome P450
MAHRNYGDLVTLPLNGTSVIAAFGGDEVQAVFDSFGTGIDLSMVGGVNPTLIKYSLQGRGPLNTIGAEHDFYREITARAMRGDSARLYSSAAARTVGKMLDSWQVGQVIDLLPEMRRLTHRIFKYYMFGFDIAATDPELDAAIEFYVATLESNKYRIASTLLPVDVPGVSRRRALERHMRVMDARIQAIASGELPAEELCLSMALHQEIQRRDLPDQVAMTREMALQLHWAGITSVASSITWALLLLAQHPAEASRQVEEAQAELGGKVPEMQDIRLLPRLDAVLNESMRLYPGAVYEFKRVVGDMTIDGYHLPKGAPLLLAPWVTHRCEKSWSNPEVFNPDRFANRRGTYGKGSFAPWGAGDRSCIGKVLGRMAITAAVGGISQRYRMDLVPGQAIYPQAGLMGLRLFPRPGVRMRVAVQDGDTERSATLIRGTVVGATPGPVG